MDRFKSVKYPEYKAINIDNARLEYCNLESSDLVSKIAKAEAERFDDEVMDICEGIARVVFCGREIEIDKAKVAEALKKQMPEKPLPENKWYGIGKCPSCGAVFMDDYTNYCGNCGQALDWGHEE